MTEEKSTTKRAPATKKAATGETAAAKAPAAKKTPTATAASRKAPASKAAQAAVAETPPTATSAASAAAAEAAPAAVSVAPATSDVPVKPSAEERYRMVESAAYFIAEKDGFQGCSTHYWTLAEREVAARLGEVAA